MNKEIEQLKGAGKMLDILWNASIPLMGEKAAKRIEEEMIYLFGEKWVVDMYKLIEDGKTPHEIIPLEPLKRKGENN